MNSKQPLKDCPLWFRVLWHLKAYRHYKLARAYGCSRRFALWVALGLPLK